MLYPFIYTRTKYHDYRNVTSKSLTELPHSVVQIFTEVARTMIDAENDQLIEPSWTLVKKNGYTLWGISILNDVLGDDNKDKCNRPVRGFFGFISDYSLSKLPYSISFFKELYATYVTPIWNTYEQLEQISCQLPAISGDEFITKSSLLNNDINVELGMCRLFPYDSDCKGLIEAVFASIKDYSIATNIHKKSQCIEFGKDKLSFMNVVGSSDLGIRNEQDIKVYVKKEPVIVKVDQKKDDPTDFEFSTCSRCDRPTVTDDNLCSECKTSQRNQKYLKYGLYGFIIIVCLVLFFKGPSIWEAILSPKHTHEIVKYEDEIESQEKDDQYKTYPFLRTNKPEFNIQDADLDQIFEIQYQSSSILKKVQPSNGWIHILTPLNQYSQIGVITFICEPINHELRDGQIRLVNEEGKELSITIHQSITNQTGGGLHVKDKENQSENLTPPGLQKVLLGDKTPNNPPSNIKEIENSETGTTVEGTN